ncbi:MAG: hypothetical protein QM831_08735 [Kofleriaceae bacterium]
MKLLVGLLKGAVIGGALGYGAFALQQSTGFFNGFLAFGVVGLLVGLLVGRPLWSLITDKASTTWVGVLKGIFGFGVGCGLYAIVAKAWQPSFQIAGEPAMWPPFLGGAIGAIYGAFVEADDASDAVPEKKQKQVAEKSAPVAKKK